MGTPDQYSNVRDGFPAWYYPLARDHYIREVAEKLGAPTVPRHLGLYVLRSELDAILSDPLIHNEQSQIPTQLQGEQHNG